MSRLEELLQTLCPDGVEEQKIEQVCKNVFAGGTPNTSNEDYYEGEIPWLRSGEINFNNIDKTEFSITKKGLENSSARWIKKDSVLLAMTGATVARSGVNNLPLTANQSVCAMEVNDQIIDYKYLYYCLSKDYEKIRNMGQGVLTSLNVSNIRRITVPVPPLPVQDEIVRILDSFTALETELENQLEAELAARVRQYQHYRNELLSFDSNSKIMENLLTDICPYGVEYLELQQIFDFRNGYTPSTKNDKYWDNGSIPWFTMKDLRANGGILRESIEKITPDAIKGRLFESNSIIMSTSATIGEHALILVDALSNQRFTCLTRKEKFKGLLIPKFVYYYCFILGQWCRENINVSGFASVDMGRFSKFKFPIPPLEVQEKIVSILERFDTLVNDLKSGLPAEIALRRKQYETYRDKLLTFTRRA